MSATLSIDPFKARDTFDAGAGPAGIYRLSRLEQLGLTEVAKLPYSIRVLLESVLRNCDGYLVTENDVKNLAAWNAADPAKVEIPFLPARVVLQESLDIHTEIFGTDDSRTAAVSALATTVPQRPAD